MLRKVANYIKKVISQDLEISIENSFLVVMQGRNATVVKYLIADEADYGVRDLDPGELYNILERFSSLFSKLPPGSELLTVKMTRDLRKIKRSIENEMLNIKAALETVKEPHVVKKLERKLQILSRIYERILSSTEVSRIVLVLKIRKCVRREDIEEAKSILDNMSEIVKTLFISTLRLRVREAKEHEIKEILGYELGISMKPLGKHILVESKKIASIQAPIPYTKKPHIESYSGVYLGVDLETGWPVVLDKDAIYKHILVLGPTGKGKTTTLALFIENYVSMFNNIPVAIDFKGDLADLVDKSIIEVKTPLDTPLNILVKPRNISSVDWALMISDILVKIMKIDQRRASNIVKAILSGEAEKYVHDPRGLLLNPDLSVLSSVVELVTVTPNYNKAFECILKGSLINLNGYGVAYQNIYGGLLLHLISYMVSIGKLQEKVVVIDEAWRIGSLKALYTLVKEGRSRRVGVILATQNIEDIPMEIIENVHTLIIFGGQSDEYIAKVSRILGLKKGFVEGLKRLSVGEALLLNMLDPHPVFVRIEPPLTLKKKLKLGEHILSY